MLNYEKKTLSKVNNVQTTIVIHQQHLLHRLWNYTVFRFLNRVSFTEVSIKWKFQTSHQKFKTKIKLRKKHGTKMLRRSM